jgi:hypothetical protein
MVFECVGVQNFFYRTHNSFFRKLYVHVKEYPTPENDDDDPSKSANPASFFNPLSSAIGDDGSS